MGDKKKKPQVATIESGEERKDTGENGATKTQAGDMTESTMENQNQSKLTEDISEPDICHRKCIELNMTIFHALEHVSGFSSVGSHVTRSQW